MPSDLFQLLIKKILLLIFELLGYFSGDYIADWHRREVEVQSLDNSWLDSTPTPSMFGVDDLCAIFSMEMDCQMTTYRHEFPSCEDLLRASNERDRGSIRIALEAYARQSKRQVSRMNQSS